MKHITLPRRTQGGTKTTTAADWSEIMRTCVRLERVERVKLNTDESVQVHSGHVDQTTEQESKRPRYRWIVRWPRYLQAYNWDFQKESEMWWDCVTFELLEFMWRCGPVFDFEQAWNFQVHLLSTSRKNNRVKFFFILWSWWLFVLGSGTKLETTYWFVGFDSSVA